MKLWPMYGSHKFIVASRSDDAGSLALQHSRNYSFSETGAISAGSICDDNLFVGQVDSATRKVWVRTPLKSDDDLLMHEALFAYVSDYGFLWTALQPHGIPMDDRRLQIASLDHSIWFHRPLRTDDWLLFSMESPNASGGHGLCFAHIYNRDGVLMASATQEG